MTSVAFVVFEGFQSMALAAMPVFEYANFSAGEALYEVSVVSEDGRTLRASGGLNVGTEAFGERVFDTVIVVGGDAILAQAPEGVLNYLRANVKTARRTASICSGAFVLAQAGLLDGRRATTHWSVCGLLARAYPAVHVEPEPIFVRDGNVATSAGVTAGMDLALALVEEDLGRDVALAVARRLVLFLRRPANQSQFSAQLSAQVAEHDALREVQAYVVEHPEADLSVRALADHAAMSERNFARQVRTQVGLTPARYVERVRVEAARRRLEESDDSVDAVARACGFGTAETLRRTFLRALRTTPSEYRRRFCAA